MPRIAYISSTFPDYQKCGTGIYAGYLTRALAQQGHDVHVITSAIPEIRPTWGKVTVHKVMQSWNPLDIPRLIQAMMTIKPDLIHINHPTSIAAQKPKLLVNMIPELNRHTWKVPLVTTLHEFGNVSLLGKLKLMPFVLQSDAVTVTNDRYRRHLEAFMPAARHGRIHIVDIGALFDENLKPAARAEQRRRWDFADDDQVLGFIGFLTPPKGFHNLIEAVAPLLRKNPKMKLLALSSWNLSASSYRQKIIDMITREAIQSQVIFTGFLEDDDLWDALSAIDLCVFPFDVPVEERSSAALRQVLFRGLPTIVYAEDIHYSEFGYRHGENIWFSPHKNVEALRGSILKLVSDRELREKISKGTAALRGEMGFDSVSNSMSRVYASLKFR